MKVSGSIVVIEDDEDDREFLSVVFDELNLKSDVVFFSDCIEAMAYLQTIDQRPFLILCDVNLPKLSGIKFKQKIDSDDRLSKMNIPFIFYSGSNHPTIVNFIHTTLSVQGFFKKADTKEEIKKIVKVILEYWSYCSLPVQ